MERVVWREADACALPFSDQAFDKAVCQFGVMFFPDKQAAFREALRVLRLGGEFLFNVWGRREGTVQQLAADIVGQFLGCEPCSLLAPDYSDIDTIISDLAAAGFGKPVVEELNECCRCSSARQAALATCGGGLLRHHIEASAPDRLDEITDAVADAVAARFGSGVIGAPLHAIFIAGIREEAPKGTHHPMEGRHDVDHNPPGHARRR
jgi:SAM-dependent methyltransferase